MANGDATRDLGGIFGPLARSGSLALLLLGASQAVLAQGALPKGNAASLDKGKVAGPATAKPRVTTCYDHLVRPPGGSALFVGDEFFLLAQTSDIGKAGDQKKPTVRHTLYRFSLATALKLPEAEAMLSLEHRSSVALAANSEPVSAVSAVAFLGTTSACFEGPAAVVSVALAKKGEQAVRTTGQHYFVESPKGRMFVDVKKQAVLEMDPQSFQTKTTRRLASHERGLFFDPGSRALTTWHDDGKQRGLVFYKGEDDKDPRRVAVVAGDRVVQKAGAFAVMRAVPAAGSLQLQELMPWSGVKKAGTYKMTLPKGYGVSRVGMDVSFEKRLAVVHAVGFPAQRQWQRAFVIDYASGETIGVVQATGTDFVYYAGIDPKGRYVLAEIRDEKSRRTVGLKLFDVASRKTLDIALPSP